MVASVHVAGGEEFSVVLPSLRSSPQLRPRKEQRTELHQVSPMLMAGATTGFSSHRPTTRNRRSSPCAPAGLSSPLATNHESHDFVSSQRVSADFWSFSA